MKKVKLTHRYNLLLIPVIALLFIASIISSFFLIRKILQNELDEALVRSQGRIQSFVSHNNALPVVSKFNDQQVDFAKERYPSNDTGFTSTTLYIPEQHRDHVSRRLTFNLTVSGQWYKVSISQLLEGTRHVTKLLAKLALATIAFTLLIFLLINRYMLRKMWQPFYQSLTAMKVFRINEQSKLSFPPTDIEEFQLMNEHFGTVAANARKEYKILKEFSENASHEIQTPLSIVRSNLEVLLQEPLTETQCEALQLVNVAVDKLSSVQQALLLLTKIENRQFQETTEIIVEQELRNKLMEFAELWNARHISYTSELYPSRITANRDLFEVLLNNLFSNATRHNISNGSIHIFAESNRFEISNSGSNRALDDNKVFKRFYKASHGSNNNGLGLSIVKEICNASGIQINYRFQRNSHHFLLQW